jgi:phage shock protein PspC (stress-responsive transcriptional regulator)
VSDEQQNQTPLVIIGLALVIAGLWALGNVGFPVLSTVFGPIRTMWMQSRDWFWAAALITLGILAIVAGSKGGVHVSLPGKEARLYRSRTDKMVSGVLGGIANYLSVDATIARLAFVALAFVTGFWSMFWAYIIAAIIVPLEPRGMPPAAESGPPSGPPTVPGG